jgi:hypothetical protein
MYSELTFLGHQKIFGEKMLKIGDRVISSMVQLVNCSLASIA